MRFPIEFSLVAVAGVAWLALMIVFVAQVALSPTWIAVPDPDDAPAAPAVYNPAPTCESSTASSAREWATPPVLG